MNRYKYPRTPHLPFSEGTTDDDKLLRSDEHFYYMKDVVVTVKMDGENTTVYPDGTCHARSLDSKHRDYHSWLMRDIQNWCYKLEPNQHVCGEYLYAKHSIEYTDLRSYFYAFSIWDNDWCMSWYRVLDLYEKLGVYHVPILYVGPYDTNTILELAQEAIADGQEGIVVRNYSNFHYDKFDVNVAKYVRKDHVQTDQHWSQQKIVANKLSGQEIEK